MYKVNLSNLNKGSIFYWIFLLIGVIILTVWIFIITFSVIDFKKMDSNTTSTRVEATKNVDSEGNTTYKAIYYYFIGDKEYACESNVSSNTYPEDKTKIYYNSNNPNKCYTDSFFTFIFVFIITLLVPILFIIFCGINLLNHHKRIDKIKKLCSTGRLIKNVKYETEDSGFVVNGRRILRAVVDYPLPDGTVLKLKSDPIYNSTYLDDYEYIDILIDENDKSNYYLDFNIN